MNVYIVDFRMDGEYGLYHMVVVAHSHDEAENIAAVADPYREIGAVHLIDPTLFEHANIVRTLRYIE